MKQFRGPQIVDEVAQSRHSGRSSTQGLRRAYRGTRSPVLLFLQKEYRLAGFCGSPDAGGADREICVAPGPYALLYPKLSISAEAGAIHRELLLRWEPIAHWCQLINMFISQCGRDGLHYVHKLFARGWRSPAGSIRVWAPQIAPHHPAAASTLARAASPRRPATRPWGLAKRSSL